MNSEAKFHPTFELLSQFVQGELATGKSVLVAAHTELCTSCADKAKELQASASSSWADQDSTLQSKQASEVVYSDIAASIVNSPQIKSEPIGDPVELDIDVLNHSIKLPKVLAKAVSQGLDWKKVAGGISEAQLFLDNETLCSFIYTAPGCKAPVHTHLGSESTLVLDGSFEDELGEYNVSDFIVRDSQDIHQPLSEKGCLCFAVLDSPLKFTDGLARFMNPINRYKFKKATSKVV